MCSESYYLAVFGAAIVHMMLGFAWYSPKAFGKRWMKAAKISKKDMKKKRKTGMGEAVLTGFISALVMSLVLATVIKMAGATTFVAGAAVGILLCLGFIATSMMSEVLWDNKPMELYGISVAYYVVDLAILGGLLAVWI